MRIRCYRRNSEYHLAPERPRRDTPKGAQSLRPQERGKGSKLPYSAISAEAPVTAQKAAHLDSAETKSECEHSFSTTLDAWGVSLVPDEESVAVFDTGATAILVCFRWLGRHNRLLEQEGCRKVSTYRSSARSRFGGGVIDGARCPADIPVGIAGNKGSTPRSCWVPIFQRYCVMAP